MNTAAIKEILVALKEHGALYFKHVEASGETLKIVMKGQSESADVEVTDARGTAMGFQNETSEVDSIYNHKTLKLRGFTKD